MKMPLILLIPLLLAAACKASAIEPAPAGDAAAKQAAAAEALAGWLAEPASGRGTAPEISLTREQAESTINTLAGEMLADMKTGRAGEITGKSITLDGKTLRWLERDFGLAPAGKRSLWISMHGGGGAPPAVNDQQWQNQIKLYQPEEGIYVAPRAPGDTWDLWHRAHVDPLFVRLIEDMVAVRGVDPGKVYLMGYSAGGDGVWQLAPRMADRFAAASMMAGHPNESSLLGLRNLPFAAFVGGNDAAYKRNRLVAAKGRELDALQQADPKGYTHLVKVFEGLPHWMNLKDAEAVPWMAKFRRNAWPDKIVWFQDNVTHDQFYWLQIPAGTAKAKQKITATVKDGRIVIDGDVPAGLTLNLSDALLDLDKPVKVEVNGEMAYEGKVSRSPAAIQAALKNRPDAQLCPSAVLTLK